MTCPHCRSRATSRRRHRTELGYRRFRCRSCGRRFNERTGSGCNEIQYPTDIVLLAVLWRLRYKLGFRDVAELLLQRGYAVTHETIRGWEARFAPLLAERLRAKRRGRASRSWYIDETYVTVAGRWCDRYRAIDRDGRLIDSMLSEKRDRHVARRFLRRLVDVAEGRPLRVTTDHHPAYRRVIRWILGRKVQHRTAQYLNNFMEQDHRAVKQRYYPMRGFGSYRVGGALLLGVRRVAAVLPLAPRARRFDASRRATAALRCPLAFAALGDGCGVRPTGHDGSRTLASGARPEI